jgi:hypothetical protein
MKRIDNFCDLLGGHFCTDSQFMYTVHRHVGTRESLNCSADFNNKGAFIKKLFAYLVILFASSTAWSADLYYSQNGGGSGASCASPLAVSAISWSAGNTYYLCGTITSTLIPTANGTAGSPITIKSESGAKMSKGLWPSSTGAINISNRSYIIIDGGTNGVIENIANGTGLSNHTTTRAIYADNASNLEIKNLTIQNLYVRSSTSDNTIDCDNNNGIYSLDPKGNWSIHNNIFHDVCYSIDFQSAHSSSSTYNIYSNEFYNNNIAINWGIGGSTAVSNVNIYGNTFHDYAKWDDPLTNNYHHNGLHLYTLDTGIADGWSIYQNEFYGDPGGYCTSNLFYLEADSAGSAIRNSKVYNNIARTPTARRGNFGTISVGGAGTYQNVLIANNTIFGSGSDYGVLVSNALNYSTIKNNIFIGCGQAGFYYNSAPNVTWDYNLYANNGGGVQGAHTVVTSSPGVNADGTLTASSPAINAGTSLATYFTTDSAGNIRSTWSIGALEFGSEGKGGISTPRGLKIVGN